MMSASDHELIRSLSERRKELLEDAYLLSDSERAIQMLVWLAEKLSEHTRPIAMRGMAGMSEHEASWLLGLVGGNVDILIKGQSARQLMRKDQAQGVKKLALALCIIEEGGMSEDVTELVFVPSVIGNHVPRNMTAEEAEAIGKWSRECVPGDAFTFSNGVGACVFLPVPEILGGKANP